MTRWAPPIYAREVVNKAACVLVSPEDYAYDNDLDIISNWRTSHNFPLNTFKIGLLKRARIVDPKSIVAQRLKRLSSIAVKLRRFPGYETYSNAGHRWLSRNTLDGWPRENFSRGIQTQ